MKQALILLFAGLATLAVAAPEKKSLYDQKVFGKKLFELTWDGAKFTAR